MATSNIGLYKAEEQLQLYATKVGKLLRWECKQDGPPHDIVFIFSVVIGEETFPEAKGKTKKEAKQNAAKLAVEKLNIDMTVHSSPRVSPASTGNYISKLNEYGQKKGIHLDYRFTQPGPGVDHVQKFSCYVIMDKKEYPSGYGRNKQEAKHEAAKLAYEEIYELTSLYENTRKLNVEDGEQHKSTAEDSTDQNLRRFTEDQTCETEKRDDESISTVSMDQSCSSKNAIGQLNEYCQKRNWSCNVVEVDKHGPSHAPNASGKNKQEGKQKAAELALNQLQDESNSISQDELSLKRHSEQSDGSSFIFFEDSKSATHSPKVDTTTGSRSKRVRPLAPNFSHLDTKTDASSSQKNNNNGQDQDLEVKIDGFSEFEEIGSGGFGHVYKAKNNVDGRYYAIKEVLMKNEKTKREAESLAKTEHKNIVRYHNSWIGKSFQKYRWLKESLFIQMELYEKNLKEWMQEPQNNESTQNGVIMSIIHQLLDGVIYIHQNNMIHRDMKPANIFLKGEIIKIGDFGLATMMNDQEPLTRDIGTLPYMSPEQISGQDYNHKVDIYALGLIFFELLFMCHGTAMEKNKNWPEIRKGNFPSSFPKNCEVKTLLIRKMLSDTASERPEAKDVKENLDPTKQSKTI
ncbi:interferon-induced, double-stranded RNA-activated protein kinase isoform X2 [Rhincodon typus]|uniref:interferon-induced, double-stranded RNA-activated protein kinase isoform X2 n=1 Tax=Rhincodon typus TaxID=259920 RepID=UPI00202DC2E9|nr:interferon-induced, double-stranded RNA-activated protein kinase isoform X2 [Rhincodon typus]